MTIIVSKIHLYPVKSMGGVFPTIAHLGFAGLTHDRQWMAVQPSGRFMTLRSHPQMALVETAIEDGQLVLHSFGMDSHSVPKGVEGGQRIHTEVFGDKVKAVDCGEDTANWLSQAIGEPSRLVTFPTDETRYCDPGVSKQGDHTQFADAFPLLIISEASLEDLNNRLDTPVTMDRFRPNIVVSGCEAFAEDGWRQIAINGLRLRVVQTCARCSVPTVDPSMGIMTGPEPIHTLSSYREENGEVYFGVNASPDNEGEISVGDPVTVITEPVTTT